MLRTSCARRERSAGGVVRCRREEKLGLCDGVGQVNSHVNIDVKRSCGLPENLEGGSDGEDAISMAISI